MSLFQLKKAKRKPEDMILPIKWIVNSICYRSKHWGTCCPQVADVTLVPCVFLCWSVSLVDLFPGEGQAFVSHATASPVQMTHLMDCSEVALAAAEAFLVSGTLSSLFPRAYCRLQVCQCLCQRAALVGEDHFGTLGWCRLFRGEMQGLWRQSEPASLFSRSGEADSNFWYACLL